MRSRLLPRVSTSCVMVCGGLLQGSRPAPQARRLPRVSISRSRLLCVRRVAATLSARTSVAHVSAACARLCAARVSLQSHGPWLRMCIAHTIGHSMPPCAGRGEEFVRSDADVKARRQNMLLVDRVGRVWVDGTGRKPACRRGALLDVPLQSTCVLRLSPRAFAFAAMRPRAGGPPDRARRYTP